MTCPDEITDCELMRLGAEQLFKKLLRLDGTDCMSLNVQDTATLATLAAILNQLTEAPNLPQNPMRKYVKNLASTTETDMVPAAGTGIFNYLTQISITNASTTQGTQVDIQEPSGDIIFTAYIAPEGGISVSLPTPKKQLTANTKLRVKCSAVADITVDVTGFTL